MAGTTTTSNQIKSADLEKVSAIDFVESFHENINALMQALGLTRKIEKKPGQVIKTYKVVGTLENGTVAQADHHGGHRREGLQAGRHRLR